MPRLRVCRARGGRTLLYLLGEAMPPISLSDDEMATVWRLAEPLPRHERTAYLELVAQKLRGQGVGPGAVARAAAEAQRTLMSSLRPAKPPLLPGKHGRSGAETARFGRLSSRADGDT
jgi:hypothetical protein